MNQGLQNNLDYSTWRNADNLFARSNDVTNSNDANEISFNNELRFNRNFMKPRRQLSINYDISMTENTALGILNSTNVDSTNTAAAFDQEKTNKQSSMSNSVRTSYFEPLGEKFKIQAEYTLDLGNSDQVKETRDFNATTNRYDLINNIFSNSFDNIRTQHRAGVQLWFETKKITAHGGLRVRNINLDNKNRVTDTVIQQNITNLLPTFTLRFNPSRSTRLSFNYNTNSRQPSISDLLPVPDNTNPNRIRTGNPNLAPDYSHQMNMNFNSWNALSGRYVYAGMNANLTQDAFGDSTTINSIGQQISQRVNVRNASNINFWFGSGIPLLSRKVTISPNVSGGISEYTSYLNSQENVATDIYLTPSLRVEYESDSLELELSYDFSYTLPRNTLSTFTTQAFTTQEIYFGATWRLKHGVKLQANSNYTINGQRAEGFNLNIFIVNAAISKTFLKTGNLELSLLANDILGQNKEVGRNINQNVVTDNNTTIISRYFLMKLTYRFNNNKTTEEDGEAGWH